jgi:type I restriction enzyme S subunit
MIKEQNIKILPEGWKRFKLREILSVSSGKNIRINGLKGGKYPVYGGNGLNGYHSEYLFEVPKLIIGRVGVKCGVTHITKAKSWVTDNALIVEPKNEIFDLKFMQLKLQYENLNKLSVSTAQPVISGSKIYAYEIVLPPKSEQQQIVSKIEEFFSELDKGIEELKTAQQQLKVYRQAVLKWAFEGRLTNKDVKDGELPKGWKMANIQDLAENNKHALKAGPFGSSLKKEFYVQEGYKVYGQEQVISGDPFYGDYYISEEKYQELFTNRIKAGDVLISLVGTVGKVLVLPDNCHPGIINPRLIKITLDQAKYLPKFFKYYFESSTVKSYYSSKAQGTTMDVLNLGIIKTIPFPFCSIEEQKLIIQEIEGRLSVCDKIDETITDSLKQAEALRQSILKKAFEGRLAS